MDWRKSHVVDEPGDDEVEQLSDDDRAARDRKQDEVRIKARNSLHGFDLEAPHIKRWSGMPPEARAAGCVAAMFARLELHTDLFYYDPRARVVFAVQPDEDVQGRRRGTARPVPRTVEEAIAPARSAFGMAGVAILDFIKRRR